MTAKVQRAVRLFREATARYARVSFEVCYAVDGTLLVSRGARSVGGILDGMGYQPVSSGRTTSGADRKRTAQGR